MIERLEKLVRGVGIKNRYEAMDLEETIRVVGRFCKLRGEKLLHEPYATLISIKSI